MKHLIAFCSRSEAASDVISDAFVGPVVSDKPVKFGYLCLNRSRQIPPEAVGSGILKFFRENFQPEVATDVISSAAVESVSVDVRVKLGDSRSNGSPDISGADCVSNERTLPKPIT